MIILYLITLLIIGSLIFIHIRYHNFSPKKNNIQINTADLKYFQETYDKSRNAFLSQIDKLKKSYQDIETFSYNIESNIDPDLFMDLCYIPPQNGGNRLVVMISGTHGIEGYTGSAVQQMFAEELVNENLYRNMGILLIHSFNPYGQKYFRKATEFNIDLNRNCVTDNDLFNSKNNGYTRMYRLLCPNGELNKNSLYNRFFYLVAAWKILKESFSALRQSALQGQYEFPEGLYFGGKEYAPQTLFLREALEPIFNNYKLIFSIDIHSAYGKWGKLHLFPNPEKNIHIKNLTSSLFRSYPIHWGDTEDFYTIIGDLSGFMKEINKEALTLCMPFEFGTMNSHLFFGSLASIHRMILENQGFNYGYKNNRSKEKALVEFKEMYYPISEAWRSEVIRQSRRMLKLCLTRFQAMPLD